MSEVQNGEVVVNGTTPADNQTSGNDKPWMSAWEPNQIRQHAEDWSLAADAGLLKYLQAFSTRFMAKAHETTVAINDLIHETNMTDARMRNVADRFLTLSDSQFIENRVYDEDVSEEGNGTSKEKQEEEKKDEKKEIDPFPKLKEAIQCGIKILDDSFDVLDANAANSDYDSDLDSDAEDERGVNGMPTSIYEPKDPYVVRPLPHLIGSRGFIESEDVGIKDLPSDDEEVQDDHGSISESDEDVEKPSSERKDSSSSSDYGSTDTGFSDSEEETKESRAESTSKQRRLSSESVEDSEDEDLFNKKSDDDVSDEEVLPKKKRAPSKAKTQPKSKKKKEKHKKQDADLFADDDGEDGLFGNSGGLFGTGSNLFDKKKKKGGLFDDADISEKETDESSEQSEAEVENKSQRLSSDEEEKEVGDEEEKPAPEQSSKPHGGVSLFGGALNKELLSRRRQDTDSSSQASGHSSKKASDLFVDEDEDDEDDLFSSSKPPSKPKSQPQSQPKAKSILSESDEDVKPPPVEKKAPKKDAKKKPPAADLFGSDSDDNLFGSGPTKNASAKKPAPQKPRAPSSTASSTPVSKKKETTKPSIFDSESSTDDDSMFSKKPPAPNAPSKSVTKSKGMFDSDSDDDFFAETKPKPAAKTSVKKPKPILESDSDEDGLFSSAQTSKKQPEVEKKDDQSLKARSNSLFADDSEEQDSEKEEEKKAAPPQKKKPIGAVSMFGGGFGGAELSAAINKRRAASDVSTKSSSSNDFEKAKETKKGRGLFDSNSEDDEPLPKVEEKPVEAPKVEKKLQEGDTKPRIESPKPLAKPALSNVTAKPFKPFSGASPSLEPKFTTDSSKPLSANSTAKSFKPTESGSVAPSAPKSSVSKLQVGLSIDPSALLPGAAPKPKPIVKTDISFDEPPVVKTLESFNKTRARGQRNRRPPSRHIKGNLVISGENSKSPTFVEEKKPEVEHVEVVKDELKTDAPVKKVAPVKKPEEQAKSLIDSADLDVELFSGSLFKKSDKKSKAAPKLFDDDIFGDTDDFLSDLMASKKKDKDEKMKVVDLDDEDIFGLPSGGTLSKPGKKKEEKDNQKKKAEALDDDDIFGEPIINKPSKTGGDDIFGDFDDGAISKPTKTEDVVSGATNVIAKSKAPKPDDKDIFDDYDNNAESKKTKTDSDDIFGDDALPSVEVKPKSDVKSKKPKLLDDGDLFGDDDFDFSLPKQKPAAKGGLFSDDEPLKNSPKLGKKKRPFSKNEDIFGDDIFSDTLTKSASKKTNKKAEKKSSNAPAAASIFDDEDDMNDIFTSSSTKKKVTKPTTKKAAPKKAEEKKPTSTVVDDPLSMI